MRIAVAQINTVLGDFSGNAKKIISYIVKAQQRHCDLVVFPESTIFGYHPFDLLERSALVELQLAELENIQKKIPPGMAVLVGAITKNRNKKGRPYYNSAVLLEGKKKPRIFHKQLLPTGDVFDEARFIESGKLKDNYFIFKKKRLFVTICEDIWAWPDAKGRSHYEHNPLEDVKYKNIDLIINLSASPFYPGKMVRRQELAKKTARKFKAPIIYCNLVGAQDEIIFDGGSFALDSHGKTLMRSMSFEEDINVLDLDKNEGGIRPVIENQNEEIRQALVLGLRDFCQKIGIERVHLGLSGGVDSALVACLAVDALGPKAVSAVALPSEFNSPQSLKLAHQLAKNLGIEFNDISIQAIYSEFKSKLDRALQIEKFGLVHENLQARIRGTILMAIANQKNSLLLNTSNKSELAAGYSTLYGDLCGGLSPLGDLTKEQVYNLCALYNQSAEVIPNQILTRAPSAELRPNQKDEDSLPPYQELDASVVRVVEKCESLMTKTDRWLLPVVLRTEFKRWQAPPILKVSTHSFGRGRRWPIAHKAKEN